MPHSLRHLRFFSPTVSTALRARTSPIAAALAALALFALCAPPAGALDSPTPSASTAQATAAESASSGAAPAADDSNEAETPDSTEQGQTQMTDSFEHRPLAALLHESKLIGLRDTTFGVQLRSVYLDRDNFDQSQSEAWAARRESRPATSATSP